jgi:hypothetical protein
MALGLYHIAFVFVLLELATVSLAIRGRECQRYLACAEAQHDEVELLRGVCCRT